MNLDGSRRTYSKTAHKERAPASGGERGNWRVIVAVAVLMVATALCIALWKMKTRPVEPEADLSDGQTRTPVRKPLATEPTKVGDVVRNNGNAEQDKIMKQKVVGKTPTGFEYVEEVAQTNNDGVVVSRYKLVDGSWTRVVKLQSKDTLVFESALDNQFALIAMTPVNQMLPPMPEIGNLEEAFAEAIKHPIIISENDSEKVRELKEAVKDIRQQMSDLLREGYTVRQILAEDATLRIKNVEVRREFQKELNEIYRTEGREAAETYMEKANVKLEEYGIIPLSLPESGNSTKRRR